MDHRRARAIVRRRLAQALTALRAEPSELSDETLVLMAARRVVRGLDHEVLEALALQEVTSMAQVVLLTGPEEFLLDPDDTGQ
jgi:urease beta subunit